LPEDDAIAGCRVLDGMSCFHCALP
jgi:hypothetical protein